MPNSNLPPGCLPSDVEGPKDMACAFDQFLSRLDDAVGARRDDAVLRAAEIKQRLEYLRGELRAERISYGELSELQDLVPYIDKSDVELLEAAGVPERPES